MNDFNPAPPDALLLLTSQCPHCPTVLKALSELVKQGVIGRLEAVNIQAHPETAEKYGVRSVPWVKLGDFELEGLHSPTELKQWAERAGSETGLAEYYADLLKQGQLPKVLVAVHRQPRHLAALLLLAENPDTELTTRIGVSAVLEDFAGSKQLRDHLPAFLELSRHQDPRVRSDACHYLVLTQSAEAVGPLEALSNDPERAVREVARDCLAELADHLRSQ
jgi:thiol-disulfide isomerase/thioredoxin